MTLDELYASIMPPLVVHRAVLSQRTAPCGALLVTRDAPPLGTLHPERVTCPDCSERMTEEER